MAHPARDHLLDGKRGLMPSSADSRLSVVISGSAAGSVSPGSLARLSLSLDDTNDVDVDVALDRITVTVRDVDAPRVDADHPCRATELDVDRPINQDGCKGASLTLTDEASGSEVSR